MRRALVMLAFVLGCATAGPVNQRELLEREMIVATVENRDTHDATVFLVTGSVAWRVGRAPGTSTTRLALPRAFEHQVVAIAARFEGGQTMTSERFVVRADGFTVVISRGAAGVFGE